MDMLFLLLGILACWLVVGGLGAYVAGQKRRDPVEGLILAMLLGPIGILIVALLPTGRVAARPRAQPDDAQKDAADDARAVAFLGQISPKPTKSHSDPEWLNIPSTEAEKAEAKRRETALLKATFRQPEV